MILKTALSYSHLGGRLVEQSKRQYLSEFAVSLFSRAWLIMPAHELASEGDIDDEAKEVSDLCHIYLICKAPAISFSKHSFLYEPPTLSGSLNYRVEGELRETGFSFDYPLRDDETEVRLSKYPHKQITTHGASGDEIRNIPAGLLSMGLGHHVKNSDLRNLEVLYVGQAFGDGTRSAYERLSSHSTLQKILAQAQHESPDSEIKVLTFEYVPYQVITQMDGRDKKAISDYRDLDRFRNILNTPLTDKQQICLVEAALIRYFQPRYNTIYKEKFPDDTHKILESCYDLDFSALVVEIDTEDLSFSLFSSEVAARDHHTAKIDLVDPANRWGFFHYGQDDGTYKQMQGVIGKKPRPS